MKYIPFTLLFIILLTQSAAAQKIEFKDQNLKAVLLDKGYDRNKDGEIEYSEIDTVTKLNITHNKIRSLEDLKYFKNLKVINASYNQIENLDVFFDNSEIEEIFLGNNPLAKKLVLKNIKNLKTFVAFNSHIGSIDLTGTDNVELLYLQDNDLENIAFPNLANLKGLTVSGNKKLKTIDISANTKLDDLNASGTSLRTLNVTHNPILSVLYIEPNVHLIKNKNQSNLKPAPIIRVE